MTEDAGSAVAAVANVSRETRDHLTAYVDLIRRWNSAENLVSPADLAAIWTRHIADCAQLPALAPGARHWVDIGSGAGLPGIVIALVALPGTTVHMVESNQRKCAFLRQATRLTTAAAVVHQGRAEAILALWDQPADIVTARAVAPLERLLGLTEPLLRRGISAIFPKGRGFRREVDDAALVFDFDLVQHQSRIDPDGAILEIRNLRPKGGTSGKG